MSAPMTRSLKAAITRHTNAQVALARHRSGYCSEIDESYARRARLARKHLAAVVAAIAKATGEAA
jgi:hypothetical protein